ncbi:ATPase, F1/V1/A1 complex, alpha/beta subunit [Tanacetum coccineum]
MSNKKRSTKRQIRVPVNFNDHVVGNLSQKRNDNYVEELNEQIRVLDEDPNVKAGNDKNDLTNEAMGTDGTDDAVKDKLGTDNNRNKVQGNSNGVQGENQSKTYVNIPFKEDVGRYGLKEIVDNANGCWFFKFGYEEGMNNVVEMSPWMVNGKPLMVQKWNPDIGMEKT